MRGLLLGLCLVLAACGEKPVERAALNCSEINGVDELLTKDGPQMLLFGEVHGSKEVPIFVGDVVCHSLQNGYPTILALEHSVDMTAGYGQFLSSSENSKPALMSTKIWASKGQYGVTSIAMLQLVERVRRYKMSGYDVSIAPFDLSAKYWQDNADMPRKLGMRDKLMAQNLLEVMETYPEAKIIVLTGNFHSNQGKRDKGNEQYPFMANYLPKEKMVSLFANNQAGTVWASIGGTGGVHGQGQRMADVFMVDGNPSPARAIHMFEAVQRGHNGLFYTVTLTASPPAVERIEQQ